MDVIKLTRELGAAIQQDERYLKFAKAQQDNENNKELNDLMAKLQLVQMNYQIEASKEDQDAEKMRAFEEEFNEVYTAVMENESMKAYDEARAEIDGMMNYIMQILALCVNGADPATCEPPKAEEHNCNGSCSSCSGCH